MENLTKQQIVLLTLLVSFVTSIATGIVTVSLMDQAPKSVSQTINRVVERTIERVITPATTTPKTDQGTIKETIVVHDDDQLSAAIDKNSQSLVRLYKISSGVDPLFVGLGIWTTKNGQLITPNSFSLSADDKIQALSNDGGKYLLSKASGSDTDSKISVFEIAVNKESTSTPVYKFNAASFVNSDPKLGQTIASLSGEKRDVVFNGIISSLVPQVIKIPSTATTTASTTVGVKDQTITDNYIDTSLNTTNLYTGAILINLSGEILGLKLADGSSFLPASLIKRELSNIK